MEESSSVAARTVRRWPRLPVWLLVIAGTGAVSLILGVAAYLLLVDSDSAEAPIVTAVSIEYPVGWEGVPLTQEEQAAGVLIKLSHESPDASFLARGVPGRPEQPFDVETLGVEIERALTAEIEGFEVISRTTVEWGSFPAVQIHYRQPDEAGVAHQVLMVVIPTERQTFYVSMRAPADEFPSVEAGSRSMIDSFVAYIDDAGLSAP